ncbi:hypothetical protein M3Y99_01353500 [Aphelenchoides fujianensis]|nr:hypothetical protein M3Y99_01353500 [Aphelenchoides fujianensis]
MRLQLIVLTLSLLFFCANAQLAAVYSDVKRTDVCSSWSSWGPCVWPDMKNNKTYLQQLTGVCRQHWFFKFVGKYESALDSFFNYMQLVMRSGSKPCGLCAYRQSCGYGGSSSCNLSPFVIPGGRAIMPFFVSEKVCNRRDLKGFEQTDACELDYDLLKANGGECQLWPSKHVDLSSVEAPFRQQLYDLKWYSCVPQTKADKDGKKVKSCFCCCYPFRPLQVGGNFKCVHDPKLPPAPGMDEL